MFKYTFQNPISPLIITSIERIQKAILNDIQYINTTVREKINHNIAHSEAFIFNNQKPNRFFEISDNLRNYLETNINLYIKTENLFNPFSVKNKNPAELITFKGNTISKNLEFELDTALLRQPFLIDVLFGHLKRNDVNGFCISHGSFHRADNLKAWNRNITLDEDHVVPRSIQSTCVFSFFQRKKNKIEKEPNLGAKYTYIFPKYILLEAETSTQAIISKLKLETLTTKDEFEYHARFENQNILVVTWEDEYISF